MSSGQIFVIVIIAMSMGYYLIRSMINAMHGIIEDEDGNQKLVRDPEADRLRDEVKQLKERIAVLERLATDGRKADELDREIEKLRLK